jgi:hypothetical protein
MQTLTKKLSMWVIIVAIILMIPVVGMQVSDEWNWTLFDFVFAATVLFGTALTYELVSRKGDSVAYRVAVGVAVVTALLLVWVNAAVGFIGDGELDFPNGMYFVMLFIALISAFVVRFKSHNMSYVLFGLAIAQMLVPVIALIIGINDFSPGLIKVFCLSAFFAVFWIGSGMLFRRASVVGLK